MEVGFEVRSGEGELAGFSGLAYAGREICLSLLSVWSFRRVLDPGMQDFKVPKIILVALRTLDSKFVRRFGFVLCGDRVFYCPSLFACCRILYPQRKTSKFKKVSALPYRCWMQSSFGFWGLVHAGTQFCHRSSFFGHLEGS